MISFFLHPIFKEIKSSSTIYICKKKKNIIYQTKRFQNLGGHKNTTKNIYTPDQVNDSSNLNYIYIYIYIRTILNKSRRQHPTKQQLYSLQPPITKTIQVRRTRYAGHCWRSRDKFISHVLRRTPSYGRAKAGRPARTYIQQLCEDTGCSPGDETEVMNDREG